MDGIKRMTEFWMTLKENSEEHYQKRKERKVNGQLKIEIRSKFK